MTTTRRSEMMRAALTAEGFSPTRAGQILDRLAKVAKKKRQAKVPRIDRERKAVTTARSGLKDVLTQFFPRAAKDMARQIIKARKLLKKADDSEKVDAIVNGLDFSSWQKIQSDVADILISITQNGIGVGFDQIGFAADAETTDQVNAKAVAWARERSAELVGMTFDADGNLVVNPNAEMAITESTRGMLRSSVARAIENGTSTADFADELEAEYAFSADRAEAISRTEIASADVQGNLMSYRDSGVVSGKEWLLGSEHDDDDECDDAADMGVVPLDDDFGGIGDPPAHPNCFLGDTLVSAAGITAHYGRRFEGKISVIRVAGQDLAATPNHPILTPSGWVAIGTLKVGDDVFQCIDPSAAIRLLDPQDHQIETAIEDIPTALLMARGVCTVRVPTSAVDFHGDGLAGEQVDIVRTARTLIPHGESHSAEHGGDRHLALGHRSTTLLSPDGHPAPQGKAVFRSPDGVMSGGGSTLSLGGADGGVVDSAGVALIPNSEPGALERVSQSRTMAADPLCQVDRGQSAHVFGVDGDDLLVSETAPHLVGSTGSPDSQPSIIEVALHDLVSDSRASRNRLDRLAALMRRVQVTDVRQFDFSGHVHNLSTRDHWYLAGGIIAHNCVCDIAPVLAGEDD